MLNNNFADAPTVGSTDTNPSIELLQAQIHHLEKQLATAQTQRSTYSAADTDDDQPHNKKRKPFNFFKKIRKFFSVVIAPILIFIPKLITSIAKLKEAVACLMDAKTRAKKAKKSKLATA